MIVVVSISDVFGVILILVPETEMLQLRAQRLLIQPRMKVGNSASSKDIAVQKMYSRRLLFCGFTQANVYFDETLWFCAFLMSFRKRN